MAPVKHGHTRRTDGGGRVDSPEYRAFTAMKNRCLNRRQARYKDYGARGIVICERWLNGDGERSGFECFLADMGRKPSPAHTLDRRENEGNYEPGNCRWATRKEQANNTRSTRWVRVCDVFLPLASAASFITDSPPPNIIRRRLKLGWTAEDAALTPVGRRPIPALEVCF